MRERLNVCVFGAGVFAGYHAQKVAAHERSDLVGIYDPDQPRAQALVETLGGTAFAKAEDALSACNAVIVAVPAIYHKSVAIPALASGHAALIEKPLAENVSSAEAITLLAKRPGAIVQVGHQERIVAEAIGLHQIPDRPRSVEIVRQSGRATRNLDTSVVFDLMIHDLDLLRALFGNPDWMATEMAKRIYSDHLDTVRAEIGFGEMTAYVAASRDAEPERRWTLRYDTGTVEIDFGRKTLRHDTPYALNADFGDHPDVADSLAAAFDRFVRACLDGDAVLASAEDGLAAVRMAAAIEGDA